MIDNIVKKGSGRGRETYIYLFVYLFIYLLARI